jgi:hypothetical protein
MSRGKSALGIVRKYHPNVTIVEDATEDLGISVTAKDAKYSRRKSPDCCAMAKACQRSYDGAIISLATAYVIKGKKAIRYKVPQAVTRELVSFDRNHEFAPGDYVLKAPPKTARLGPRIGPQPVVKHRRNYGKVKIRVHHTAGIRSL